MCHVGWTWLGYLQPFGVCHVLIAPSRIIPPTRPNHMLRHYGLRAFTRAKSLRAQIFGKQEFDLQGILDNYDAVRRSIEQKRLGSVESLDYIRDNYSRLAELGRSLGALKRQREELQRQQPPPVAQLKDLKLSIRAAEHERTQVLLRLEECALALPAVVDDSVTQEEQVDLLINCTSVAEAQRQRAPSHLQIGRDLGILNMDTAARVSGHLFYYLVGDGALLEQALVQYALATARAAGYRMVAPPTLVRPEVVEACGFRPRDTGEEQQVYSLEHHALSLTATSEISIAALELKRVFDSPAQLPLRYVGVSRAFRAEAGARGALTAGLYRVHEFTKVELFHFTTAARAWHELEEIKRLQAHIVQELGLTAKVLNMPASDLGFPAAKKYDIEVWMPGRQAWGEVTLALYCRDYQLRRVNTRYRDPARGAGLAYAHTLNGTAMAVPRVIVAILETFWDPHTRSVAVPPVLRPYMGGLERIEAN